MKKLNRKGFTLVELLAVIVILAIVVGITLVTVLPTLKKSRQEAFKVTAQTAADYLEKQYQLSLVGESTTIDFSGAILISTGDDPGVAITPAQYSAAGLKSTNYSAGKWYINTATGRACVKLTRSTTGEYNDADEDGGVASSSGCKK